MNHDFNVTLFFHPPCSLTLWRLLLDVCSRQVSVHQGWLPAGEVTHNALQKDAEATFSAQDGMEFKSFLLVVKWVTSHFSRIHSETDNIPPGPRCNTRTKKGPKDYISTDGTKHRECKDLSVSAGSRNATGPVEDPHEILCRVNTKELGARSGPSPLRSHWCYRSQQPSLLFMHTETLHQSVRSSLCGGQVSEGLTRRTLFAGINITDRWPE